MEVPVVPTAYDLSQNYPNPFNPTTEFEYSLAKAGQVNVSVFNLLGQKVADLVNTNQKAGKYRVTWNADNLPSGVYFYRLEAGSFSMTRKMLLLK